MGYAPPFTGTPAIDDLCMQIAELVGALGPASPLRTSPRLHRELRIRTIRSSLMIEGNTLSRWRPVLAWLPVETVIRDRQQDYYAALARSNAAGSCEDFVAFILTVIRDALVPYASSGTAARSAYTDERTSRTLTFFSEDPTATVADLAAHLDCSRRTAERVVAELRTSGRLVREGSARADRWVVGTSG